MKRRAGLHADQAGCKLAESVEHDTSPQLLLQNSHTVGINAVKLKNGLCNVDTECCKIHVDGSSPL